MEKLSAKLRKEAECSLCIETIKNPKILPCHHGFCCECLNRLAAARRQQGVPSFECPECKAPYELPENGRFDAFPASFHHNRLLDLLASVAVVENEPQICSSCKSREMDYFCGECKVCICAKCVIRDHKDHALLEVEQAAEKNKSRITQMLDKVKNEVKSCQQGIQRDKQEFRAAEQRLPVMKNKVRTTVEELIRVLRDREADLLKELDELHEEQHQRHLTHQKDFEQSLSSMNSCLEYGDVILQRNVTCEFATLDHDVLQHFEVPSIEGIQGNTYDTGEFVINEQLVQTVQDINFGQIVKRCTIQSRRSIAEGKGLEEAECGELAEFTVSTLDSDGETRYSETDKVTVLLSSPRGCNVEAKVEDCKDGTYHVTYLPQRHGEHHVTINIRGQALTGSPWKVRVIPHQYRAVGSFGSQGTGKGQFDSPTGIAVNSTGDIAVADYDNGRVQLFTSEGKYLGSFGSGFFSGAGKLCHPMSLAYTRNDDIIVADFGEKCPKTRLYTKSGSFLREFSPAYLKCPRNVSITREGHVIACDLDDRSVKILSHDGRRLLRTFKTPDCDQFSYSAVDYGNRYFVAYFLNGLIKVWDKAGEFLFDISGPRAAVDSFELDRPLSLSVDTFYNLIVCEAAKDKLQVLTLDGQFICIVGETGTAEGQFKRPADLAVAKDGQIYVVDQNNHRIQIFK